ncbi:MAG: DUF308 domain-containing protein [Clostridiales bacterium]|jgi:uncharacterized membrane protein HdeD (DUF308 family)|nr:DUF308 domain-containing protein [Clostridiales bacterium]
MNILNKIEKIVKRWYAPLISGIIFICAGIGAFAFAKATIFTLILLVGLSFLLSGIIEGVASIVKRKDLPQWGWSLILGCINLIFGLWLLMHPAGAMILIAVFVSLSVMFRSIGGIILSIKRKKAIPRRGLLLAFGILGVIFSFILLIHPLFAWTTIVVFMGMTLIVAGIFCICLSLFLRKLKKDASNNIDDAIIVEVIS